MNETPQQVEAAETEVEVVVLRAECVPSLKGLFMARLKPCGFRTQTEAILTLARDFVAGRIQYTGGVLVSQQENNQPDSTEGQGRPPAAPESSNEEIKATL